MFTRRGSANDWRRALARARLCDEPSPPLDTAWPAHRRCRPLNRLVELVSQQIWHAEQPLRLGPLILSSRMTVVRLAAGELWVHSPVAPTPEIVAGLKRLGPVRFVVAPNRTHHLYFDAFLRAFPEAQGFVAEGLSNKRPELRGFVEIEQNEARWAPELQGYLIEGLPALTETLWFHAASGTLIVTDLLASYPVEGIGFRRILATALGVYDRLAMSWTMRRLVTDRSALGRSLSRLRALDIQRIVLCHETVVETDAADSFWRAFDWLGRHLSPAGPGHAIQPQQKSDSR